MMLHADPQWTLRDEDYEGWQIRAERSQKWIRVRFAGVTVASSKRALIVMEIQKLPIYYFPLEDVRTEFLKPSKFQEEDQNVGIKDYWHVALNGQIIEDAAWGFATPKLESNFLKGYVAFVWEKAESWLEEEEVFVHARDPYTRIDAIPSSRRVKVIVGGEVVAESTRPVILYETGLTSRYYLPREDVRMELLTESEKHTRCPYKGIASFWTVNVNGNQYTDAVWSYAEPLPEVHEIQGLISFYNEAVDSIVVDGKPWMLGSNERLPYSLISCAC
ncbi:DUF427 domain-containing protein [Sporolactobacillus shoreicorticis]|uniref:DUF427 domain-containing protein n=1 Tax=Sporolactobacillus shoreicorticis TaxID=1923877 RepID=A0ABW5S5M8_9BACL|nr:DUF427 domain-containing protein [Sporolactobacillus shoreicorticis]MCO7124299.1 DUF427 domain-containing protein [Sporolactobacillus shoreicorticis]